MLNFCSNHSCLNEEKIPFSISRVLLEQHQNHFIQEHDYVELVYIVRGDARYIGEGNCCDIHTHDIIIFNSGENHYYEVRQDEPLEMIQCRFNSDFIHESLLRQLGITALMDDSHSYILPDKGGHCCNRLNLKNQDNIRAVSLLNGIQLEWRFKQANHHALIKILVLKLLVLISRYKSQNSSCQPELKSIRNSRSRILTRRVNGFLESHYAEKLSISAISELFNISTRQMNRIFKKETGLTLTERVHEIRIKRAKQYLVESDEKVIQIAILVGYEDPTFFSNLFRRQVGCPPGKFRKVHQEMAEKHISIS
ncbi:AraC family transcriptional regulator [Paenibacillus nasutitermitis]|uniref:AraC family transcriptional regulator n=1 Tax=Paenibacillus nasutitermitis TaxID=1652958 RepID=A0A916ZDT0_9BACL|nr:AraC family transcriptional regulator [Paenibacillus nasutitermitis]GGD89200.1 AraC family transcriptional regulator [Paenibacillus nasutitermitis]